MLGKTLRQPGRIGDELRDRLQRHAGILERDDATESGELRGGVEAIAAVAIDLLWHEQADAVVEPQRLHGNATESRQLTDAQHVLHVTASPYGRVKRLGVRR